MIPPGVDLEPHLALRRDLRRVGARARRQARAAPRVDLLAVMQNWTDPPRNRPPGLDPASQFLHDAFDGVAAGVAPLVPRSVQPSSDSAALEALYGCDCKEGARKGDPCGQGGTIEADAEWEYIDGGCHLLVQCVNQACHGTAEHWLNGQTTHEKRVAAAEACDGGSGAPLDISCSYDGEACHCTTTIACNDGSTGTADVTLDAMGSVDKPLTEWDDLCPPSSDWKMPGSEGGWGEATGGGWGAAGIGDAGGSGASEDSAQGEGPALAGVQAAWAALKHSAGPPFNGCVTNQSSDYVAVTWTGGSGYVAPMTSSPCDLGDWQDIDFVRDAFGTWHKLQFPNHRATVTAAGEVVGAACAVGANPNVDCPE